MYLDVQNIQLYYKVNGAGEPLLLIHGNQENHTIFNELAAILSDNYEIYQIDSRNHGLSNQSVDYGYDTMANDIVALIDKLNLRAVHLLGFSDGAIISLLVSQRIPKRIQTMALLGINLSPKDFKPEIHAAIEADYIRDKHPLTHLMLTEPQLTLADLARLAIPTLVVAGEDDCCAPDFFKKVAKAFPQGELLVFPNHDHSSYIVNRTEMSQPLIKFHQKNTPAC